ncbi:DUF3618 domain-containing protein [Rhizomonospora bruguierae]|uniref:DUF3618 domain-containing protein n=1 Tax=Rhizomonospora bruguierae TaxID=1581705 RepID=UPI001BCA8100|nr:DUF3618 domain-containing protein [Micromonospora sp. NBRC 107566]
MTQGGGVASPRSSNGSAEALREEIRQTRAELGETVQALAARADVKARVRESAEQTKDRLRTQAIHAAEQARVSASEARDLARRSPVPWFALAGAAAVLALVVALRGRRG